MYLKSAQVWKYIKSLFHLQPHKKNLKSQHKHLVKQIAQLLTSLFKIWPETATYQLNSDEEKKIHF